jgi:hypothetical protein
MARAIPEEPREYYDPEDFNSQVREFIRIKETLDALDKRSKELREKLMAVIDEEGLPDSNGNLLYEFDQPIDGVVRIEKQRRASRKLDEEKAEVIIEAAGIGDDVYKMVRVIDEDALMASFYEEKITEEQIDEMFPVVITWALRTPKK